MVIYDKSSKTLEIPVGLGNNAGGGGSSAGVSSLNGQTGNLYLKTVNGNQLLGRGNIDVGFDGAVESAVTRANEYTNEQVVVAIEIAQERANDYTDQAINDMCVLHNSQGTDTYASMIWTGTQDEYNALWPNYSNNTLYFIND